MGILFCIMYQDLLKYRKVKKVDPESAAEQYPKINFVLKSWGFGKLMLYSGLIMIIINLFISFFCTKNPYAWPKDANIAFFCLTRSSYALGWMLVAFYIIFGHSNLGKLILGNPAFNAMGKLVYPAYLISPIIMMIVYANTDHGIFMSMLGNMTLGMGHMFIAFIVGFFVYSLIQWPITRLMQIFMYPLISHDYLVK